MRTHQHYDPYGMSREQVGKTLFVMGVTPRVLSQKEIWTIEQRALKKIRRALRVDMIAMKGEK